MAHWFHRNPIKATDEQKFELKNVPTSPAGNAICGELRNRRQRLVEHFSDASRDLEEVENDFNEYLSYFGGFIVAVGPSGPECEQASKLVPLLKFKWSNSMLGPSAVEMSDSWFEGLNMVLNMALWLTKHGAWTAAKDEVREGEAKRVHSCFRKAAGMFQFVLQSTDKVSGASASTGSDLDSSVLHAYIDQCTAEAQEVTVARAIELKHSSGLISALAHETSNMFTRADKSLESLDASVFGKWRLYMQLKAQFYMAYAYAFLGESLLAEDKCGDAIRACKEGIACYHVATDFADKYAKTTGPGMQARPEQHLFFRRIEPLLKRHLDKAERENSFIYHQKVADDCPGLEGKATFGLVKAEPFTLPPLHKEWNVAVYTSFDLSKAKMPDVTKMKKSWKHLTPVREQKLYETDRDPANDSGCVIS